MFQRFLDWLLTWIPVEVDLSAAAKLDPDRITVEAVAVALHVRTRTAKRICETAVRQGLFIRTADHYRLS